MLTPPMQYSKKGEALTIHFEGKRNRAYWDKLGKVWTISYGATGPGIREGVVWDDAQCLADLETRLARVSAWVNRLVNVPLTQGEFDALVDFGYNCGIGALQHSHLLELVNESQFHAAALEFHKWSHASGQVVAGLLARRVAEQEEFEPSNGQGQ